MTPAALPLLPARAALALARTWWRHSHAVAVVRDWARWRLATSEEERS